MLRIAMISEHASPLAAAGEADSGGQNFYVAQLARHLAREGHQIDVYTRRDSASLPETAALAPGARVIHVNAGPASFVHKEGMLPLIGAFVDEMLRRLAREAPYDLAHAHFWMSGLVACQLKRRLGLPFVVTFHGLGRVSGFPPDRLSIERRVVREADAVIAGCPREKADLAGFYQADPRRMTMIPRIGRLDRLGWGGLRRAADCTWTRVARAAARLYQEVVYERSRGFSR